MAPECRYTLPNGRKCRGLAVHNQPFCRHHGPKFSGPPPLPRRERYSRLSRWARLSRQLPWLAPSEIPSEFQNILLSLLENGISDREAGRLLRGLLLRLAASLRADRTQKQWDLENVEPELFVSLLSTLLGDTLPPEMPQSWPGLPQSRPQPLQSQPSLRHSQLSCK